MGTSRADHKLRTPETGVRSITIEGKSHPYENVCRLALTMGQDPELVGKIEAKKLHPAMAAFGLWKDQPDLAALAKRIQGDREKTL